ncbi:MAG: alanine racemase [Lachnospiraceae bacterium]|nr:alanine racemase [Lachnospiraceae bacterium]
MDLMSVCAHIDLDAIFSNISALQQALSRNSEEKEGRIFAVIKADAYGHGAVPIARFLDTDKRIGGFAVATFEEAMELYEAGIRAPILILGYTFSETYLDVVRYNIRPTIFTREMAEAYHEAAVRLNKDVHCHIKIDTGMGRIGFPYGEASAGEIASLFQDFPRLVPEGIFTHFARADEADKTATDEQFSRFDQTVLALQEKGISFPMVHAANSAAIMEYEKAYFDKVRAGIILYGLWPSEEVDRKFPLHPVLSLHSHIVHIKTVEEGTPISYGGTYRTKGVRRIATVPVGYGDGYCRGLSNKGDVLIRQQRAPIVGRVCMDQFMVDITDIPEASLLDEVTLVGADGEESITLEELGAKSGRFNYEFACGLGNRIPRLYFSKGKLVDAKEYFDPK